MSAVSVKRISAGREGGGETKSKQYSIVYMVLTDDKNDGAFVVCNAVDPDTGERIPLRYQPYYVSPTEQDAAALCISANGRCDTVYPYLWIVTARFSTDADEQEQEEDPLDRPGVDDWSSSKRQEVVEKDTEGNVPQTTVGQPFTEPVERPVSDTVLVWTQNEPYFDPALAQQYQDAVNSDTFLGIAPGYVRLESRTGSGHWEKGAKYYEVRTEFHIRKRKWNPKEVLNRGTWFREAPDGAIDIAPEPIKLKEDGTRLEEGDEPYYVPVPVFDELPFSVFNIVI